MANVGKNIRTLRTQKKMTQDELAEKLFVSRQTVSNYETGKSNPDIDTLVKIAGILDADANALIYGIPVKPDGRKERLTTLVLLAAVLCLGLLLYRLTLMYRVWMRETFITSPLLLLKCLLWPGYYLLTGWTVMRAAGCFLHTRTFSGRYVRPARRILIAALLGGLVLLLPGSVMMVRDSFTLMRLHQSQTDYSFSATYFDMIPVWDYFARKVFLFLNYVPPFLFLIPGAALWLTKSRPSLLP